MMHRRARASALLLWLVACGGGSGPARPPDPDPCAVPADGAGFLAYVDGRTGDFDIRAVKLDGTCDQLVGPGPGFDLQPSWSAAAGLLAWNGTRGGTKRVVLRSLSSPDQRLLDTGPGLATGAVLSEDGMLVAYELLPDGAGTADIYVVPSAGGVPVPLTEDPANDAGPVFSSTAQGRFVYFVSNRSGPNEVWRVSVTAAGAPDATPEQVTTGSQIIGRPAISGDGRLLAYTNVNGDAYPKVMIRDLGTGVERTLTDEVDSEPAFPSSGSVVAVKTGRYELSLGDVVLLDLNTGAVVKRLTNGSTRVGSPAFPR